MALQNKTKSINLTANSVVDGVMQDQTEFEVEAYALLDSMTPKESTNETI